MSERNPTAELLTCLEVLSEYVDNVPSDNPDLYNSEFLTACWQTVELTLALFQQHNELLDLMERVFEEQKSAAEATKLVVADMNDLRAIREGR